MIRQAFWYGWNVVSMFVYCLVSLLFFPLFCFFFFFFLWGFLIIGLANRRLSTLFPISWSLFSLFLPSFTLDCSPFLVRHRCCGMQMFESRVGRVSIGRRRKIQDAFHVEAVRGVDGLR